MIRRLAKGCGECVVHPDDSISEAAGQDDDTGVKAHFLTKEGYNEVRSYVQMVLSQKLRPEQATRSRDPSVGSILRSVVLRALIEKNIALGDTAAGVLVEELGNDLLGYGPIEPFFYDPEVTEIKVQKDKVRVEKQGVEKVADGILFRSEDHVRDVLERILAPTGRKIDMASPRVNARLPDGSRLIAHIPPVAVCGAMFTIRRFKTDMTMENLLKRKVMSREVMEFLRAAVVSRQNMVVSGGTSSGKTTVLNCLASFIPEEESLVTIEDPAELRLQHTNVRSLEAKPATENSPAINQRDLLVDALRMAPRRVIVGECRAGEAFDMLQAMNTGHKGSMTTIHSNSARHGTRRLLNMVQMARMDIPNDGIVEQIADALDIFIHVVKDRDGRRRMDHVCEVTGVKRLEGVLNVDLNPIWQYNRKTDCFERVGDKFMRRSEFIEDGGWQG